MGSFSQVLAIYLIAGQFASAGLWLSVQRFIPEYAEDRNERSVLVSSALCLTAVAASIVCLLLGLASSAVGSILDSHAVSTGVLYILPGLWCFAINKILLAAVNGLQHMRFFASVNALRFLLMLVFLGLLMAMEVEGPYVPILFTGAEVALFALLIFWFFCWHRFVLSALRSPWSRRHLSHGWRALPAGIILETNTRVDLLMLGYFSSDSVVGIYGFIATFAEGIGQIPVIVQINLNPILTRLAAEERMDEIRKLFRKTAARIYPAMAGITVITLALFPFAVKWIAGDETFLEGHRWLGALLIGLTIAAGYTPFAKLLNQAGIPGKQTLMVTAILLSNVVLNFILIPKLGGMGAAVATSGAVVLGIFYLKLFVRRSISLRL